MGFNVTLQARGGNTTPDRTENRWNSNFINTVHGKAEAVLLLSDINLS